MNSTLDKPSKLKFHIDNSKMQLDVIYAFLTQSYWSKGISKQTVKQAIENSICFGAFIDSKQVAFARVITDKTSFAYLADVFVLEEYRGAGISKKLMAQVTMHQELQSIRRFLLCTADAHKLYEKFGFSSIETPEFFMSIHKPNIYKPDLHKFVG